MEKCLFVFNPQSGKGKIKKNQEKIEKLLSEKYQVEVCPSQYAGHIGQMVLEKGGDCSIIVVAGGDGTLNEVVNSISRLERKPKIGYVPSGTVNDVARSLRIPKKIKKSVKIILQGDAFAHDIFRMNDRYGIYVCCAGLFTESSYATSQSHKRRMGKIAYAFHGIKKVFSTPAVKLKLTYDGGQVEDKFALMLVLNSRSVAGLKINRKASLNDGFVDVALIRTEKDKVNLRGIFRVVKFFLFGLPKKSSKNIKIFKLDKFNIETTTDTIINLDGEKIGAGSFDFEVVKAGVQIIVPNSKKLMKN